MWSTMGECTGMVRSTPTPKLTLRTVNVSRTPPPWRRITTPWKTWMRSRLPSVTRTWTFTVSPGRKSGTSLRREAASIESRVCIRGSFIVRRRPSTLPQRAPRAVTPRSCQQIGTVDLGTPSRLLVPPRGDGGVVTGQQHRWHVQAAPGRWPGVGRGLEQAVLERLLDRALLVAHDPGQQPRHRLHDDEDGHLTAGEHVVADRHLFHRHPAPGVVDDPGVKALVASG